MRRRVERAIQTGLHINLGCIATLLVSGLVFVLGTHYIPYSYPYPISGTHTMDSGAVHLLATLASNATSAAANGTAAAVAGHKAGGKKPKKHYYFMARNSWETIAGVIIALAIINVFTRGYAYRRRRRHANQSAAMLLDKQEGLAMVDGNLKAARIPQAGASVLQNLGMCTTLPWWLGGATSGEAFWNIGYCAALGVFAFHQTKPDVPGGWGNQAGHMAYSQIPLIIGLAGKNNVISFLTGIGYEKLNYLHRTAGRANLFLSWIHVLGRGLKGYKGGFAHELKEENYLRWGIVAIVFYTVLTFGSFRALRNRAYELFLLSHIVMVIFYLVGCWLHWAKFSYWVYPGLVIWGFDRLVRVLRLVVLNKMWMFPSRRVSEGLADTKVEVLGSDVLRVTVQRGGLSWRAGQHAFLIMPTISKIPFEAHPFTISNISGVECPEGQATFIIRARDGFTKRLMARAGGEARIPAYIEGPYGHGCSLNHYEQVILVCGGSGISFGTSNLIAIIDAARRGESAVRRVKLVWMMRSQRHWQWVQNMIMPMLVGLPESICVELDFYVTAMAVEPNPTVEEAHEAAVQPMLTTEETDEAAVVPEASYETSSGIHSGRSSVTDMEEKLGVEKEKYRPESSLESNAVTWHSGRADLRVVLSDMVDVATGPVSVNVCGPRTLQAAASQAVKAVATPTEVLKGQQRISYYAETFGW